MDDGVLARIDAIEILKRWMDTEEFPDRMMGGVPPFRRGFVMDLVYTTLRNIRALDFVVTPFIQREPENHALPALWLGACQILKMPDVAEHAAVHATVEALKELDGPHVTGFANAILRNVLRNLDTIIADLEAAPLAVRESHTDEQVERWIARYGAERAAAICAWDNEAASVTVVTVPGGPSVPELIKAFADVDIETEAHPGTPDTAIIIPHGSRVTELPGFDEGRFAIQDPATLEAVLLLDVHPGQRVLDACASPGGKSVQIGLRLENRGRLVATDCWPDRLPPLEENIRRFGLTKITDILHRDARRTTLRELNGPRFDRILLDVPCSNTGVQRRRADARWRFTAERLAILNETQVAILENTAAMLADGGRLVYSTCSLEKEENEDIIDAFLQRHPQFQQVGKTVCIPPDRQMDGAFCVALEYRN